MSGFDYKKSLTDIKASLFDIYEDQEKVIGDLDDSIREQHVNDFIEVKDLALNLLEKIQGLYQISIDIDEGDEKQLLSEISSNVSDQDEDVYEEETSIDTSLNDENEEQSVDFSDIEEDVEIDKNFYLLCNEKKLNFAYVPENLLDKLKKYKTKEDDNISYDEESSLEGDEKFVEPEDLDSSLEIDDSNVYKKDKLPAKGIIVRNDQYMKLALSKHRQEGVLEEAKQYRIDTIKKKRQEEQKIELEKAKVHLDI